MHWMKWGVVYLRVHFLLYALMFRNARLFSQERVILRYHVFSGLTVTCVLLVVVTLSSVVSLHGIYSASFLKLWSLAQNSYSMSILQHVEAIGSGDATAVFHACMESVPQRKSGELKVPSGSISFAAAARG